MNGEAFSKLIDDFNNMPELRILQKIETLDKSRYIFIRNYSELKKLLEIYSDLKAALTLWDRKNRQKQDVFHNEVTRLLHNYVASAMSLREHTRSIYRELYKSKGLLPEYQDQVDNTFANNKLAQFIERFRVYCQHYKAAPVFSEMNISNDPTVFKSEIKLDINALKKFDGWNTKSKEFIDERASDVVLLDIVDSYYHLVIDFHAWFIKHQKEIHQQEMQQVNSKRTELAAFILPGEINSAIADAKSRNISLDEALDYLLSPVQREELKFFPEGSPERSEKLITFIEEYAPLSENLKNRIREFLN